MGAPETEVLRRAAVLDCIAHGTVLGPIGLGSAALAVAFATEMDASWIWLAGAAAIGVGIVAAAYRLLTRHDTIIEKHRASAQEMAVQAHNDELDQLHQRLSGDNNPKTQAFLADIRRCQTLFQELEPHLHLDPTSQAIAQDLAALIQAGLHALHTIADLWDELGALSTNAAKEPLYARRFELIEEIGTTVALIAGQLDTVRSRQKDDNDKTATTAADLVRLRGQLEENLAVAQRIDQRISSFENEILHAPSGQHTRAGDNTASTQQSAGS